MEYDYSQPVPDFGFMEDELTNLPEGIEKTVKWYLDNEEWLTNVTSGDYQKYYDNMYKNR